MARRPLAVTILIAATSAILVISVLGGLAEYGETIVLSNVGQTIVAKLRRDLFRQLMRLPTLFHTSRQQGDLLMRLTGDIVLLRELLVGNILDSVGALLVIFGTLLAMLWMDWRLTLLSLAIVPMVAFAGAYFSKQIRALVQQNRAQRRPARLERGRSAGRDPRPASVRRRGSRLGEIREAEPPEPALRHEGRTRRGHAGAHARPAHRRGHGGHAVARRLVGDARRARPPAACSCS